MVWWKDFSNILAILAIVAGFILLMWGPPEHQDKGWITLAYALGVGSKSVSRSKSKTIKVKG